VTALLTVGRLARRCGVSTRTVRFWSDEGLLPPAGRSAAGHRRFDATAVARLDLVRALRELGLGLDEVRAVLERRRTVAEVAAAHVQAIDGRLRTLRVQRAICTLLAEGELTEEKITIMNDLARLSAQERQRMIDEFVDATFAGIDPGAPGAGIATAMRTLPGALPDEPSTEQVRAWTELAELVGDPGFRVRAREMAVTGATGYPPPVELDWAAVAEHAGAALDAGIAPDAPAADPVVQRLAAGLDPAARDRLAATITVFADRRVERYWTLLGVLNGWPPRPPAAPAFEWFAAALRAGRRARDGHLPTSDSYRSDR
jgi:DNA-binding transcriptional MerR regulator